ncbi:MAG: Swt1 family HEPN domain-containing protein [Chloroflexi bacterium]|nr:Swt1 family HEPN domain-containing protein [Chloroflexota bacterium]
MQEDDARNVVEEARELRRQLAPLVVDMRAIADRFPMATIARDVDRYRNALLAAYDPLAEMRRAGHLELLSQSIADFTRTQHAILQAQNQFVLPQVTELSKLLGESNILEGYARQAAESIQTPWIDVSNMQRSIDGFAKLHGIGSALRSLPPFGPDLSVTLRSDLGDWREESVWPQADLTDVLGRTSFYAERGLNPDLTAFPADAFRQIVTAAGLQAVSPPVADDYNVELEFGEAERDASFQRNNRAHDLLQRFESRIREFIDERMTTRFGPRWVDRNIPHDMRSRWVCRKQQARADGERDHPLIAYADFTDYLPIITRKDNWKAFKGTFGRKESVQESFLRLYPVRKSTMHARLITNDDELYLHVETMRLLKAVGVSSGEE